MRSDQCSVRFSCSQARCPNHVALGIEELDRSTNRTSRIYGASGEPQYLTQVLVHGRTTILGIRRCGKLRGTLGKIYCLLEALSARRDLRANGHPKETRVDVVIR